MKILITLALIMSVVPAWADDYALFGMKARVERVTVDGHSMVFDQQGSVTTILLCTPSGTMEVTDLQRSAQGFVGNCQGGRVTLALKNKRLASATHVVDGNTWNYEYAYDREGLLTSVKATHQWTEWQYGSSQRRTETSSATYTYVERDQFGNWVRRVRESGGYSFSEAQQVSYSPDFISQYVWDHDVAPSGDLGKIEAFWKNRTTTSKYRTFARKTWNAKVMDVLAQQYANDPEILVQFCGKEIMDYDHVEECLVVVRDYIYNTKILPERDFMHVRELANLTNGNGRIFDDERREEILLLSERLRQDSIQTLLAAANLAMVRENYDLASEMARATLDVDPENVKADRLCAEAEYQLCMQRRLAGTATEQDYVNYLSMNPSSPHIVEVQNLRALAAANSFGPRTTLAEALRVKELPMDAATQAIVNRRVRQVERGHNRVNYIQNRGSFVHFGFVADISAGKAALSGGGGVGMRLGWNRSWLNLYTGAQVDPMVYMREHNGPGRSVVVGEGEGSMKMTRLAVPVVVRLNLMRRYTASLFLSAGAVYHLPIKAKYSDGDADGHATWYEDRHIARRHTFTVHTGFGYAGRNVEAELYTLLDPKKFMPYDEDYIRSTPSQSPNAGSLYIADCIQPSILQRQLTSRLRVGLSIRFLFGK